MRVESEVRSVTSGGYRSRPPDSTDLSLHPSPPAFSRILLQPLGALSGSPGLSLGVDTMTSGGYWSRSGPSLPALPARRVSWVLAPPSPPLPPPSFSSLSSFSLFFLLPSFSEVPGRPPEAFRGPWVARRIIKNTTKSSIPDDNVDEEAPPSQMRAPQAPTAAEGWGGPSGRLGVAGKLGRRRRDRPSAEWASSPSWSSSSSSSSSASSSSSSSS